MAPTPPPYVLDTSVLTEIARGDLAMITLVQIFDERNQPLVIPVLALVGALLNTRSEEAEELLAGLDLLDAVTVAPLNGVEQAAALANALSITELEPWDAHVAAIADVAVCPILTLDSAKWQQPSRAFDEPLHVREIADPDPDPNP